MRRDEGRSISENKTVTWRRWHGSRGWLAATQSGLPASQPTYGKCQATAPADAAAWRGCKQVMRRMHAARCSDAQQMRVAGRPAHLDGVAGGCCCASQLLADAVSGGAQLVGDAADGLAHLRNTWSSQPFVIAADSGLLLQSHASVASKCVGCRRVHASVQKKYRLRSKQHLHGIHARAQGWSHC